MKDALAREMGTGTVVWFCGGQVEVDDFGDRIVQWTSGIVGRTNGRANICGTTAQVTARCGMFAHLHSRHATTHTHICSVSILCRACVCARMCARASVGICGECNRITGVYIYAVKLLTGELFFVGAAQSPTSSILTHTERVLLARARARTHPRSGKCRYTHTLTYFRWLATMKDIWF